MLLQSVTISKAFLKFLVWQSNFIIKCERLLLPSASGITKWDSYYKVRHNSSPVVTSGVINNMRQSCHMQSCK